MSPAKNTAAATAEAEPKQTALALLTTAAHTAPEIRANEVVEKWLAYVSEHGKPGAAIPYFAALIQIDATDTTLWPLVHEKLKAALHPGAQAIPAGARGGGPKGKVAVEKGSHAHLTLEKKWKIDGKECKWAKDWVETIPALNLSLVSVSIPEIEVECQTVDEKLEHLTEEDKDKIKERLRAAANLKGVGKGDKDDMTAMIGHIMEMARAQNRAAGKAKDAIAFEVRGVQTAANERVTAAEMAAKDAATAAEKARADILAGELAKAEERDRQNREMQLRLMAVLESLSDHGIRLPEAAVASSDDAASKGKGKAPN